MTALKTPIIEKAARFKILRRFPHVALAVSGGPDSLALMILVAKWRARRRTGPELTVLTVDHGLQPGSRDEALSVSRYARDLGLRHAVLTWEHDDVDAGLQVRARAARYDLMVAYCHRHDIGAIVTAHHLDDQAETFLMRLARGSGLDGLAAIPARGTWAGLPLLRPLLDVPKSHLAATVAAAKLDPVVDPSNTDTRFERGRLRRAMDAMGSLGLSPEGLARSATRLGRAREALDSAADDFLTAHAQTHAAGYAVIDQEAFKAAPDEIALRALVRLLPVIGGIAEPVQLAKLEALVAGLKRAPDLARCLGRCRIVPGAGQLLVSRELRKESLPVLELRPGERALWDNRFRISLGSRVEEPVTIRVLGEEGLQALKAREAHPRSVPRLAAMALPACWRENKLLCLPDFGQALMPDKPGLLPRWRHEEGIDCQARFLSAAP